ncbi:MAG: polysaccharide biosynthesis protein [Gammaproteobacteria bacterium]|nr:polysaccharide biosynthesis protein [Gammaproteobacteria bacterium]
MPSISKRFLIIFHDICMAVLAWFLSWWIRYNLDFPFPDLAICLSSIPLIIFLQTFVYWRFNLYRGIWRFASLPDLWNILRASLLGGMLIMLALFLFIRLEGVPRSLVVLYPTLLVLLLGGPRLGYRYFKDRALNLQDNIYAKRLMIIGAGRAGEMLVRDMLRDEQFLPVGFIDDNQGLSRSEIHGIRVLGTTANLSKYVDRYKPDIIVIAIPSATDEQMQRIVQQAEQTNLPVRTLPKLNEMIADKASVQELRKLSIEDLLGREKIELDWSLIQKGIVNKRVLVTGGGGSIGAELCRQIISLNPERLIIFERNEFNLYQILNELSAYNDKVSIDGVLGDICDLVKLENTFQEFEPQVVFHAAAYKHVPMLEKAVREAVNNNVFGTVNLVDAAEKFKLEKFVFISTDKAVNPINVLGATKRIGELYSLSKSMQNPSVSVVRFGNVLGSGGSVIPVFQDQIGRGGPVTVTHPEITRYFMTIQESSQLILQAASMGNGGEIFVLDMGNPVKILYLAEQMIHLSGKTGEVEIEITGLRPGEKMNEELFYKSENVEQTVHKKIELARHGEINTHALNETLLKLRAACDACDYTELRVLLKQSMTNNMNLNNVIKLPKVN